MVCDVGGGDTDVNIGVKAPCPHSDATKSLSVSRYEIGLLQL